MKLFQTRLQALSVIVNSRSSKEIFSPDELNLLEVSIPNLMVLINPADRQDFVNLVKKVSLKHEFAILSKTFVFSKLFAKKSRSSLKICRSLNICLAQSRFVINVPKQVTKLKGYVATLITLILIIRS